MDQKKALEIIKTLIDQSIKRGVMENIDTAVAVAEAFNIIAKEIFKNEQIDA
jgi:hypothetical protein